VSSSPASPLVVISNRLPLALREVEGGGWRATPGEGGLVSALTPLLQRQGGVWVGWPGAPAAEGQEEAVQEFATAAGYNIATVPLSADEVHGYYYGFANEILWPLFHGFETRCNFVPGYWQAYTAANRKFAAAAAQEAGRSEFTWVHDYQLMLVGEMLREAGLAQRLGYFLHIPFPAPEIFFKLPWRAELLRGLLAYDLIGFQTLRARRNFVHCLQQLDLPGLRVGGRGDVVTIRLGGRQIRAGAFPISINYRELDQLARSPAVAEAAAGIRERFAGSQLLLGMDRLDYTKGIPERLDALGLVLQRRPDLRDRLCLVQLTIPSREDVPEYRQLRAEIEQRVSAINGEYTVPGGRPPVQYLHQSLPRAEVAGWLRAADVALVTPLRDGMNLVAKEYCACQVDAAGALVLSEFAGAAVELARGALLVNPYDVERTADAIEQALALPPGERRARLRRLRSQIARHDIYHWLADVLHAAFDRRLSDEPRVADHLPPVDPGLITGGSA
jgi:trehalose 6-phosphate synthase